MHKGNLVYAPAQTTLLKFNKNLEEHDPMETYIGPAPVQVYTLKKPRNLLLLDESLVDEKYIKIWHDHEEWYVNKNEIKVIQRSEYDSTS